jgi:tRNA 5-methylaminomethyl-2-thiouridine biosynthesis bifunctional protein
MPALDIGLHRRGRTRYTVLLAEAGRLPALLAAWRADPGRPARLHVIVTADAPDAPLPGFARLPQAEPGLTLDWIGAAPDLAQVTARVDLFLAGGAEVPPNAGRAFERLAARDALLAFDGRPDAAGAADLARHGFVFDAGGTEARFASRKPRPPAVPEPDRRAIVVGAGLAGAAAAERLCARGWDVTLVERHARPASEASGNLAGIFMPLVSKDDNIPTRLTRAAYLFALRHWALLGGVGEGGAIEGQACGVLQLARDAAHADVQRSIADAGLPPGFARWLDRNEAEALLGLPAPDGGWLFPQGGWARPGSVCDAMLAACAAHAGARFKALFGVGDATFARSGEVWIVRDGAGAVLAEAPTLILANGTGALRVPQAAPLPLVAMRGQVTHVPAAGLPALPLVLCREAYLTPASHGICSAGATYDLDPDPALREASQRENLGRLRALLSDEHAAQGLPLQGRVGFRCIAPDRLPLAGPLPDFGAAGGTERLRDVPRHPGLYALLGYASRGLIWAGFAAELLAAQIEGEPLPLEASLADALDPARFVLRARRAQRGPAEASDPAPGE